MRRRTHPGLLALAALCGLLAVAVMGASTVASGAGRQAVANAAKKKKKGKRHSPAGPYIGVTDLLYQRHQASVTFRLTPDGTIVDFRIDVLLDCTVETGNPEPPFYRKGDTIAPPPMSIGPLPRRGLPVGRTFRYQDPLPPPPDSTGFPPPGSPPFRGIYVSGRSVAPVSTGPPPLLPGAAFEGQANLATFSDTWGAIGTEECDATGAADLSGQWWGFDWAAKKAIPKRHKKGKKKGRK